jgi:soluble lytic murein transglycosylase
VNDVNTNVALGTAYLKMLKDEFEGSEALAAAGYNAGPGRPRKWRTMSIGSDRLDAAAFAENVPFLETRDYIKRVLSNATVYAALISGKPQSLKARLGAIGARGIGAAPENKELP